MANDSREDSFREFFELATNGFAPYGWQLQVAVDGLPDVLPVPTGLGKTEVALAWAWRLLVDMKPEPLHLVVCLPMRSLVTQTVQRLKTYFDVLKAKKPLIDVAVHQLMGGAIDDEWVGHLDRPWVLVGTQDQLLSRALNRGYSMSRFEWPVHFGLLNNDCRWLIDEVQLMGPGLWTTSQLDWMRHYGTKFLPDYPQALLKLGRFRGTKITGDILDNKQEHLHAFAMVREAIAWLDRTLPLSARFPKGAINREDRLPVPAEALREIVINAGIHRDVSNPSSYVAIAVFDDRIEIHSIGGFPTGMRAELLTQEHRSIPRNPLIAGAFHRTGAIEVWGRGTNRVIEACRAYGIAEPTFTEGSGAVTVTFKAEVVAGAGDLVPGGHQVGTKSALSPYQVQVLELAEVPRALAELMVPSGRTDRTKFRDQVVAPLLEAGLLEMTIPDKPRSSKQQYRITEAGRAVLATARKA